MVTIAVVEFVTANGNVIEASNRWLSAPAEL